MVDELLARVERITPSDDTKLLRLRTWLDTFWDAHPADRVIVFSEFRDTIDYLEANLGVVPVVRVDGSMPQASRREALEEFAGLPAAVLLATDAAGEGSTSRTRPTIVIHYELPWNPNRLEQRNGRVDRYGQEERTEVRYFHLRGTRDAEILDALRAKLARISDELGSSADVLGVAGSTDVIEGLLEGVDQAELEARLERARRRSAPLPGPYRRPGTASRPPAGCRRAVAARRRPPPLWLAPPGLRGVPRPRDGRRPPGRGERTRAGRCRHDHRRSLPVGLSGCAERTVRGDVLARGRPSPAHGRRRFPDASSPPGSCGSPTVCARLYAPGSADRVVARAVVGEESGWLVTFSARVSSNDGQILEEPLLAVYVARGHDGAPGW